jgi:GNAT superfamily N-acetyltransferase
VRIEPVRCRRDLREFIALPQRLHPATHAVPLMRDIIERWYQDVGPHRPHGSVRLWLVRDPAGTVVGRGTTHTDPRMDRKLGASALLLGAVEAADNNALQAFTEYAEALARAGGRRTLLGPVSLLPNQVGGVVTNGFDEPGFLDSAWNPEWIPAAWEQAGYSRIWPSATWVCDNLPELDPDAVFPRGAADPDGTRITRGSRKHLTDQLPLLRDVLNASFAELPYYTPITADELDAATDGLQWILDESLFLMAMRGDTAVAFVLVIPDLTTFARRSWGRLGPLDQIRLLAGTRLRKPREAILIIKGTHPDHRGQGLMSVLSHRLLRHLVNGGYHTLRVTFVGDDNATSAAQFEAMGGRRLHEIAFYRKDIPTKPERSAAARVLARSADWGRAPSAHNTQPWHITVEADDQLRLDWHPDRHLPIGDPGGRDLMLSLGAVAETITIIAGDEGLTADVTWNVDRVQHAAATIALRPDEPPIEFTVAELVDRTTARSPYAEPFVDAETVAELATAARLPDGAGLQLVPASVVDELLPVADVWSLQSAAAGELAEWFRPTPTHPRYFRDGLTGVTLGLKNWEAAALGWLLRPGPRKAAKALQLTRLLARQSTARPTGTVVALTAAPDATDADLGELGRVLLRSWLHATRHNLSVHPLSQLIDCPQTASHLATKLPAHPYAVFRLGTPTDPPARSSRLTD